MQAQSYIQDGMDPNVAQQQAAKIAFKETGFVPPGTGHLIFASDEERHRSVMASATSRVGEFVETLQMAKHGDPRELPPGIFLQTLQKINPDATPQDLVAQADTFAQLRYQQWLPKMAQQMGKHPMDPAVQMATMQLAAGVAGHTPSQWAQQIQMDPTKLAPGDPTLQGLLASKPEAAFTPGGMDTLRTQAAAINFDKPITEVATKEMLQQPQNFEAIQSAQQQLMAQNPARADQPQVAGAPAQTPGEVARGFKVQQVGAETTAKENVQKQFRVPPQAEKDTLTAMDDTYVRGRRLQQLAKGYTSSDGKKHTGMLDKYGSYVGGIQGLINGLKANMNSLDPDTAEYVQLVSTMFNFDKKEISGTTVPEGERADLIRMMPDANTPVRTALQKINAIMDRVKTSMDRSVKDLESNYPGYDISFLNYKQLQGDRQQRLARQQQAPSQPVAGAQPAPGMQPTQGMQPVQGAQPVAPPQPIAPAQAVPGLQSMAPAQPLDDSDYDYAAARRAGVEPGIDPHETEIDPKTGKPYLHWDSRFKKDHHPHRFIPSESGIYDTKNNKIVSQAEFDKVATPAQRQTIKTEQPLPKAEVQGFLKNSNDLPPITQQADAYKQRFPSEAAPKVGPSAPGNTAKAAATVPKANLAKIQHQDKLTLNQAMTAYGAGDMDDRTLETTVAKVLGRTGLTGPELNTAVAQWTEVLKRGAVEGKGMMTKKMDRDMAIFKEERRKKKAGVK